MLDLSVARQFECPRGLDNNIAELYHIRNDAVNLERTGLFLGTTVLLKVIEQAESFLTCNTKISDFV